MQPTGAKDPLRDGDRPAAALRVRALGWWLATTLAVWACAASRAPDPELAAVWQDYRALPEQRALAIAGELRHDRWVAGASGGHALRVEAEAGALRECRKQRKRQRMQDPCRIYAVGNEVVWREP
jgi:hypothetical protein